jgi:Spy/CpxP family protein refolding chaperone
MKLPFICSVLFLAPALLSAQDKGTGTSVPAYTELKQYLSLTDAQLQSLQTILENRSQAVQIIYTQISQKNETLSQLLNSDSGTAAQLGQLLLEIRSLQKQLPLNDAPYKTQALSVLTADQKTKLPKLAEALQLQATAGQAGILLLIDTPVTGPPGILPIGLGTVDRGFLLTPATVIAPMH